MIETEFGNAVVRQHFANAEACHEALVKLDPEADFFGDQRPRYLFRGEAHYYSTSTPGTYRALTATYATCTKFARIDATGSFVEEYESAGGDPEIAEALAQHYLSTSDGLDFSSSPGVALAFALDEKESDAPRRGYVAVMDLAWASKSARLFLRDLRAHPEALRPIKQSGFVAVHRAGAFSDLKEANCRGELGIDWYSFDIARGDIAAHRPAFAPRLDTLYDIRGDVCAARMIQHLESLIRDPSSAWGKEGLAHLVECRERLLARRG